MKKLTRCKSTFFGTSASSQNIIDAIGRNEATIRRVNFLSLTYLQFVSLSGCIEKNTCVISILTPATNNTEIYGPEHVTKVISINERIKEITEKNSKNSFALYKRINEMRQEG
uniref:Uncharacterized protein n=1 Tax=viral metagenome TaxID=1070528 RepID=A0A6H1ZVP6_9ZZZZ